MLAQEKELEIEKMKIEKELDRITPEQLSKIESILKEEEAVEDNEIGEILYRDTKKGLVYSAIGASFAGMVGLSPVMAVTGAILLIYQAINAFDRYSATKLDYFKKYNKRIIEIMLVMIGGLLLYFFGSSGIWLFLGFVWTLGRITSSFFGLLIDHSKRAFGLKDKIMKAWSKKKQVNQIDIPTVPMTTEEVKEISGKAPVETKNKYNT